MELCHRKHSKLVLAVSFNLTVMNDMGLVTIPPKLKYQVGMDTLLKVRCLNHLIKLHARGESMSDEFQVLARGSQSSLTDSEGEWVAPPSEIPRLLGLPLRPGPDSDFSEESDSEEAKAQAAATNSKRPRAVGSKWQGKMRA